MRVLALVIAMLLARNVGAADEHGTDALYEPAAGEHHEAAAHRAAEPPVIPQDATWAGALVTGILFMFFAAAFLGFVYTVLGVDVLPKTSSTGAAHNDPHAHDPHGHGHH